MAHHCVRSAVDHDQLIELVDIRGADKVPDLHRFRLRVLDYRISPGWRGAVVVIWLHIEFNLFKPIEKRALQLINPNKVSQDQFVWCLESVRRGEPFINQFPNTCVTTNDVPRVAPAGIPVRIVVLRKGQMARRIRPQWTQVSEPR